MGGERPTRRYPWLSENGAGIDVGRYRPRPAASLLPHAFRVQMVVADVGGRLGGHRLRGAGHRLLRRDPRARRQATFHALAGAPARRVPRQTVGSGWRPVRPVHRRLHRRAAVRVQPAGVERHLGAGRAFPRLRPFRLGRSHGLARTLPPRRRTDRPRDRRERALVPGARSRLDRGVRLHAFRRRARSSEPSAIPGSCCGPSWPSDSLAALGTAAPAPPAGPPSARTAPLPPLEFTRPR